MIRGRAGELADFQVFQTVFSYCLIIIAVPVISFFFVKLVLFDDLLQLDSMQSNVYSAVCTVIILHLALGLYIFRAYRETEPSKPDKAAKVD